LAKKSSAGSGGSTGLPRIPPSADVMVAGKEVTIQVNHCKNPTCANFGIPANPLRKRRQKGVPTSGGPGSDYTISGTGAGHPMGGVNPLYRRWTSASVQQCRRARYATGGHGPAKLLLRGLRPRRRGHSHPVAPAAFSHPLRAQSLGLPQGLKDVLTRMPSAKAADLSDLLSHRWQPA